MGQIIFRKLSPREIIQGNPQVYWSFSIFWRKLIALGLVEIYPPQEEREVLSSVYVDFEKGALVQGEPKSDTDSNIILSA